MPQELLRLSRKPRRRQPPCACHDTSLTSLNSSHGARASYFVRRFPQSPFKVGVRGVAWIVHPALERATSIANRKGMGRGLLYTRGQSCAFVIRPESAIALGEHR
jgi:hypothetical protein